MRSNTTTAQRRVSRPNRKTHFRQSGLAARAEGGEHFDTEKSDRERELVRELRRCEGTNPARADEIKTEFVRTYAPAAERIARRYGQGDEWLVDDMRQEAIRGVLVALNRFDPDLGPPFTAYAFWWMLHCAQHTRGLYTGVAVVRWPVIPSNEEKAKAARQGVSLGQPASPDSRTTIGGLVPCPTPAPDRQPILEDEVRFVLRDLSERDRYAVAAAYGVSGLEKADQWEIAESLGMTRQGVSAAVLRSLRKLTGRLGGSHVPTDPALAPSSAKRAGKPSKALGKSRLPRAVEDDSLFARMLAGCNGREADILRLRKEGLTVAAIAGRVGVTDRSIRRMLRAVQARVAALPA